MARKRSITLIVVTLCLGGALFIASAFVAHRLSLSRSDLVRLSWRMLAGPRARPLANRVFDRTPQRIERGQYLTEGLLACFRCHSDRDWNAPGAPPAAGKKGAGHIAQDNPELVVPNITPVSVEKVPQLMLVAVQCSSYKQARVLDAAVHHYIWRPAAHDGTPFPRGVAVLLLPARRSGS